MGLVGPLVLRVVDGGVVGLQGGLNFRIGGGIGGLGGLRSAVSVRGFDSLDGIHTGVSGVGGQDCGGQSGNCQDQNQQQGEGAFADMHSEIPFLSESKRRIM